MTLSKIRLLMLGKLLGTFEKPSIFSVTETLKFLLVKIKFKMTETKKADINRLHFLI